MTVPEVIEYAKNKFHAFDVYTGKVGNRFPENLYIKPYDILISYISPWIVPENILKNTRLWNINFHPGPPEYPGIGCFNFAVYNNETFYGVTAHVMEKHVDKGKIIGVKRFELLQEDTVYSLSIKSYSYLFSLFIEVIDYIAKHKNIPHSEETWKRKPYTRRELEDLCKIDLNMNKDEIERRIRATTFPNMPGAYIEIHRHKFEYNERR